MLPPPEIPPAGPNEPFASRERAAPPSDELPSLSPAAPVAPCLHPPGVACPACGYDLAAAAHGPCPECGRLCVADAGDIFSRRAKLTDRTAIVRLARAALFVAIVYPLGVFALMWDHEPAIIAAVACSLAIVCSAGAAWPLALLWPAHHRRFVRAAWLRRVWMLNLPWLVAAPCAVLAFVVEVGGRLLADVGEIAALAAFVGFCFWVVGVLSIAAIWLTDWVAIRRAAQFMGPGHARIAALVVAVVVWIFACALGLLGGAGATFGVVQLADNLRIFPVGEGWLGLDE